MAGALASARRRSSVPTFPVISAPLHARYDAQQQVVADGTSLTTLTDYSGNSRTFTKTAGTLSYDADGIGGIYPAFDFVAGTYGGTSSFTSLAVSTAITVFIVARFTTLTSTRTLLAPASGFTLGFGISSSAWYINRGGANTTGGTADGNPHRFRIVMAASGASTSLLTVDGVSAITGAAIGSGAQTTWRLGANGSTFENFVGKVGEVLIYAGTLTGPETTAMEAYLSAKWGI